MEIKNIDKINTLLENEIKRDEKIFWMEMPNPNRHLTLEIKQFFMGIYIFLFSIFWIYSASNKSFTNLTAFSMFGFIIVFQGLYYMFSPILNYVKALNTLYVITNQRVVIIKKLFVKTKINLYKNDIEHMETLTVSKTLYDLILKEEVVSNKKQYKVKKIGFFGIETVKAAEEHLNNFRNSEDI